MTKETKPKITEKQKCSKCFGFGWHPLGQLTPIGQMDAYEWGEHVIKCPWCNKGVCETDSQGKYKFLVEQKRLEEETKLKNKQNLKGG